MSSEEKMFITVMTLNVTNSVPENQLMVGLMAYIDHMMGLDYEQIAKQLEFVAEYAKSKSDKKE